MLMLCYSKTNDYYTKGNWGPISEHHHSITAHLNNSLREPVCDPLADGADEGGGVGGELVDDCLEGEGAHVS